MFTPYIGITDFTSFDQVKKMLRVFKKHKPGISPYVLQVGVMMSYKTLNGIESKWSKAFPPKEDIARIFDSIETFNCLHYADYEHSKGFWLDLSSAISYGGAGIHAVQLDMTWPDPGEVASAVHASRKHIEVILQIGQQAFDETGYDSAELVRRLEDYEEVIHRVLLDKSMGRGRGMDAVGLIPYAWAIQERFPSLGIGAAGGLGPHSLSLVEPLLEEFPHLSIDAQGKLRESGSALDPVDWDLAEIYLVNALKLLKLK